MCQKNTLKLNEENMSSEITTVIGKIGSYTVIRSEINSFKVFGQIFIHRVKYHRIFLCLLSLFKAVMDSTSALEASDT